MYKIVKEIHTYQQNKVKFKIKEKFLWKWIPSGSFSEYDTYEEAENAIIKKMTNKCNGIVEKDDNNIYKFYPYSLPIP